jgi:hypothetical protein
MMKRLKEGKIYEFRVEKKVTDPLSIDHFILTGPDDRKYLLPVNVYRNYGISKGTFIKCRVDKVNCRGQIFLEPMNPYYSEGSSYEFIVEGFDVRTDHSGNEVNVFMVRDIYGNIIFVPCDTLPEIGAPVHMIIERISKGRLYLFPYQKVRRNRSLRTGGIYEFRVDRIAKGVDDDEYFVIIDENGVKHTISKAHYDYYGFKPGDIIKGKVVKYVRSGEKIIEPENPYYKVGKNITLKVTGYTQNMINDSFTLDLTDKFGFAHCIQSDTLPEREMVRCRVKMIRKGKPLLILL